MLKEIIQSLIKFNLKVKKYKEESKVWFKREECLEKNKKKKNGGIYTFSNKKKSFFILIIIPSMNSIRQFIFFQHIKSFYSF